MKDFRINKKENNNYIVDVRRTGNSNSEGIETLEVEFADGRVFKNIACCDENMSKIVVQLENQAKAGVENIEVFEKRKTKAGRVAALSLPLGFSGGGLISAVVEEIAPEVQDDPSLFLISMGAITLMTAIPSVYSLIKNNPKVKELTKIKFRNDHREELKNFNKYENALAGLSSDTADMLMERIEKGEDPFSVIYVDSYSQADLEAIVENIDREKTYGFTYAKKPAAAKK